MSWVLNLGKGSISRMKISINAVMLIIVFFLSSQVLPQDYNEKIVEEIIERLHNLGKTR